MSIAVHLLLSTVCIASIANQQDEPYDPLKLDVSVAVKEFRWSVEDQRREREIPVRVFLPNQDKPAPLLVFSHGLGGTRDTCAYLGKHWSQRGYAVVSIQHPGSDEAVWKDVGVLRRREALRRAASGENYLQRVRDVPAVLDQFEEWSRQEDHPLFGKVNLKRVGMSGHSFGAVTTQAVSGQATRGGRQLFTDSRIAAAVSFSPSTPRSGTPEQAFSKVSIPWMLMTGTKDDSPIGDQSVASRREVYPALPDTISKYELVLHDAEHSAFTERDLPGDREPRNPNHHRAILALSTAFWDANIKQNQAARDWLDDSANVKAILEDKDEWQFQLPKKSQR